MANKINNHITRQAVGTVMTKRVTKIQQEGNYTK